MKIKLLLCFLVFTCYSFSQSKRDQLVFSHNSGVYNETISLEISNSNSDKIYYYLNGSSRKKEYKRPIRIKKSTTIKVKNKRGKQIYVRNYLFPGRKITLPIVCISMDKADLFDSRKGIYAKGKNASPNPPYKGANFHKHWERGANIEFIDTNNKVGFNQKTGIKIFGQFSSSLPQKSFSIHARKKYGNGKIKYELFPDLPYKKYKSFVLRNAGSDNCNSHFRDIMMTSLVKNFNIETQDYRSCVVYLNGYYWGIYHIREKINEHYLKQHHKIDKNKISILKHKDDIQYNDRLNYRKVLRFLRKRNLKKNKNIIALSKLIDIDNYLDYNIAQVYFGNIDAGGNIRYWRETKKGGKWRWILFDTDFGFALNRGSGPDENTLKRATTRSSENWPYPSWSTLIIRRLLSNDSIKEIYIKKFSHYLNTDFRSDNVVRHINGITKSIEAEIPYHFKKWKKKKVDWQKKINPIIEFAEKRPDYLFNHLKDKFKIDSFYNINLLFNSNQGLVYLENKKIDSGYSGRHFSNIQYRIRAEPKFGYDFSHWTAGNTRQEDDIFIKTDTGVSAYFMRKDESDFNGNIYINEVSLKDSLYSSYIEIYNSNDTDVNISNWIITKGKKKLKIRNETWIKAKSFYIIFRDTTHLNSSITNSQKSLFKLKKGNRIKVFSSDERLVDELYLDSSLFTNTNNIEYVNTYFNNEWSSSEISSLNKKNYKQIQSEHEVFLFKLISGIILLLIILITLFLILRKRKKKFH